MFNKVAIIALATLLGCTTCAAYGTPCAVTVTSTVRPGIADGCDIECESGCIADGMFDSNFYGPYLMYCMTQLRLFCHAAVLKQHSWLLRRRQLVQLAVLA